MRNTLGARLLSTCLALLLSFSPALVFADVETAREYYRQASEAYQNGDLERAADLLERAYAEDPNLVYQYNRILALKGLGQFKEAMRVLEIYENPMMGDTEQRFTDVQDIKADLRRAIERQEQDEQKDAGDGDVDTDPKSDGNEDGDAKKDEKKDGEKKSGDGTVRPPPADGASWVGYTLLGAGAISTAFGVLFASGALASDELDRAKCGSNAYSSVTNQLEDQLAACGYTSSVGEAGSFMRLQDLANQYEDDVDAVDTQKVLAGVFIGTGVALLVAGGVVWIVTSGEPSGASTSAEAPSVQLSPYVSHDGFGGVLEVTF